MKQPVFASFSRVALVLTAAAALAACQGKQEPLPEYSIGGTVGGLLDVVVLQNNGGDALEVQSNGAFTFATPIKRGDSFAVTVQTQPAGQTCNVTNGEGVASETVTDILVTCTGGGSFFTIGGTVTGLDGEVVLQTGTQQVTVTRSGSFTFATAVRSGTPYAVTVAQQPADQTCTVTGGIGIVVDANISNVLVTCVDNLPPPPGSHSIGGTVGGLSGGTLRLGLDVPGDAGSVLDVTNNGAFTFAQQVEDGDRYAVRVVTEPDGQSCTLANGSGTADADVTNVTVTCTDDEPPPPATHSIGGTVSGLSGGTLRLDLGVSGGPGGTLDVTANGTFTFAQQVEDGDRYSVRIDSEPDGQSCTVENDSGNAEADVTDVAVTCTDDDPPPPSTYSIGGTVGGLTSGTLRLGLTQSGGGQALDITGNGSFVFPGEVEAGDPYAVTIAAQPDAQTCTLSNGSGTASADVTDVLVQCQAVVPPGHTVGGTVEGLTAAGLAIEDGSENRVTLDPGATSFTLPVGYDDGAVYDVGVASQPTGQTCVATRSHGAIAGGDVSNVGVACLDNTTDPLAGTYAVAEVGLDGGVAYLTLFADGVYIYGSVENDSGCGTSAGNGVEYGVYSYDAGTGSFTIRSAVVDTNGSCGVWDGASRYDGTLASLGGPGRTLTLVTLGGFLQLTPVESSGNRIQGSFADAYHRQFWVFSEVDDDDDAALHFFDAQTQADEGATSQGHQAGVEYGCGTIVDGSTSGGTLSADLGGSCQAPAPGTDGPVDTNGTYGLSHVSGGWVFDIDGDELLSPTFRGLRLD